MIFTSYIYLYSDHSEFNLFICIYKKINNINQLYMQPKIKLADILK